MLTIPRLAAMKSPVLSVACVRCARDTGCSLGLGRARANGATPSSHVTAKVWKSDFANSGA